jgi:CRISPR-associated endonuclease/helicase Cas3
MTLAQGMADDPDLFHLSTRMCPAHRLLVLSEVKQRLNSGQPCRLISTQLIEAGVDLDFAAVYRAPCGLDALTQAAGRCNREGKREQGRVVAFHTPTLPPPGHLRQSALCAQEILPDYEDPLAPQAISAYFTQHYWQQKHQWDKRRILETKMLPPMRDILKCKMGIAFADIAKRYQIIRDDTVDLIVPWGENGASIRERFLSTKPCSRFEIRKAQRYTVSIRKPVFEKLHESGRITESNGLWVLLDDSCYHPQCGLAIEAITKRRDPEDNII